MVDPQQLLSVLEAQLPMMSEADQAFVVGCQATLNVAGAPLKPDQIARLAGLARTMQTAEHNAMGLGAPLSMAKVFKDLASATHMLNPTEHAFALKMSRQHSKGVPFSTDDLEKILNIHAAKGF